MKEMRIEKVSVVRCKSYNQNKVNRAIEKSLKLINFKFKSGTKVLLKPNIVTANVKNPVATLTQPEIIEGVCRILKQKKCKIFIGESSFMDTECFFKKSGIEKVAKRYNAKIVVFEQDKLIKIKDNSAKILKRFPVAKTIKQMDLIVNLPKLKTHILTKYTGAIKNLYGIIPGGLKQRIHNRAHGEKNFSNVLVDIYQNIKPKLNIMDGIIGMEGHGPTSGNPKRAGLILASKNTVALDIAVIKIMGLNPKKVYPISLAIKRGLYPDFNFELAGLKRLPLIKFKVLPIHAEDPKLKKLFREKTIVVNKKRCVRCGTCREKCPVKAISLNPYPLINKKICIRCFCCMEICPQHALSLAK